MHSHYNPGGFPRICAAPAFPPAPKRGTELDSGYSGKRSIPSVHRILGAVSIRKTVLPGMVIPMLKIRRPNGRLIFNMEIAIRR